MYNRFFVFIFFDVGCLLEVFKEKFVELVKDGDIIVEEVVLLDFGLLLEFEDFFFFEDDEEEE